jgi:hypothetical protein
MAGEKKYQFKTEDEGNVIPLIGVLVVLIILVAGALYVIVTSGAVAEPEEPIVPPVQPNETNITPPANQTNETNVTLVCDDNCHYQNALMNESADECEKIENGTLMDICYEEISDVSLAACLEVRDPEKKDFCVTAFAVSKDDIELCDLLDSARANCMKSVDSCIGSDDELLCRALKDSDPAKCQSDTGCLLNYSMQKQNSSSCSLIQNPVVATGCESAIKKTDKCDDLPLQSQRDYCYQIYAEYSNDFLVCTQISDNSNYRLNCLSMFAASEANYTICKIGMLQLDDRWACYTNYSLMSGDISGCEAIDKLATTNRFKCTFEFAKKYGDPSACQVIESLPTRDTCYQGTIIYSNENLDGSTCKDITDFVWMNKCYNEAAKKSGDVSLCDEIEESFAKTACIDAFNLYNK